MNKLVKKTTIGLITSTMLLSTVSLVNSEEVTASSQTGLQVNQSNVIDTANISLSTDRDTTLQYRGFDNAYTTELSDGSVLRVYFTSESRRVTMALTHTYLDENGYVGTLSLVARESGTYVFDDLSFGKDIVVNLEFLDAEEDVEYDDDEDVNPPVTDLDEEDVPEMANYTEVRDTVVEYSTVYVNDDTLLEGTREVRQQGVNGLTQDTFRIIEYATGEVVEELISTDVVSEPIDEVIHVNTKDRALSVSRIQGANRFETAALISQKGFDKADTVVIANAREFADALAGVPLAYQKDAPILLAQGNRLNGSIVEEIERLGATEAVILGGEAAVNTNLEGHLTSLGLKTTRLAGANRFETAVAIAEELANYVDASEAIFVDGFQFADAMSIAPFAAQEGMPIFLTRTHSLSVKEAADQFDRTIIVGGENAVSKTVESRLNNPTRLAGSDRYKTNVAVMEHFGVNSTEFFLSTGLEFADALTGSVLAAKSGSAVGLVRNNFSSDLDQFMSENTFDQFTLFGGPNAINERIEVSLIK